MKYVVSNAARGGAHETPEQAVHAARLLVYLPDDRVAEMEQKLRRKQLAEWAYGFSAVTIYPHDEPRCKYGYVDGTCGDPACPRHVR